MPLAGAGLGSGVTGRAKPVERRRIAASWPPMSVAAAEPGAV
jgi:hypothetical protein